MKNRLLRCVATILLLSMIVSASPSALAMGDGSCVHTVDGCTRGDHVCYSSNMSTIELGYEDSGNNHRINYYDCGPCDICGEKVDYFYSVYEAHTLYHIYTGNNYHSGDRHFCQYRDYCIDCGHTSYHWESYACPGNGHCIMPNGHATSDTE